VLAVRWVPMWRRVGKPMPQGYSVRALVQMR
jgi:hypothetical protein